MFTFLGWGAGYPAQLWENKKKSYQIKATVRFDNDLDKVKIDAQNRCSSRQTNGFT